MEGGGGGQGGGMPAVVVTPIVSFPREVQPFRMAKFIAHEVEPAVSSNGHGDEADDFVE